jgi:hypothetical protein
MKITKEKLNKLIKEEFKALLKQSLLKEDAPEAPVATCTGDRAKPAAGCGEGKVWNPKLCKCECKEKKCKEGLVWVSDYCMCVHPADNPSNYWW